jgi:transposase
MSHPRRSRDKWHAHVVAWKRSGQSGADYARRHGLNANTLAWWRWQLGRERSEPSQELERPMLTLVPVTTLAQEPSRAPIELGLPDGIVVRVSDHADPERVACLVRALLPAC